MNMNGTSMVKKVLLGLTLGVVMCGCGSFWGGAAGGAAGTGAGYEFNARKQMERLNEDLKNKKIDQKEYDIRKSQIERGSLVY